MNTYEFQINLVNKNIELNLYSFLGINVLLLRSL